MAKIDFDEAASWVARAVVAHPAKLMQALAAHFGVGRTAAATLIARLVEDGYLLRSGAANSPVFAAGKRRLLVDSYSLPVADPKAMWEQEFAPFLHLSDEVAAAARVGFVSVVHNANRHARASGLYVVVEQSARQLEISLSDNGVGIFQKIAQKIKSKDLGLAVAALAAGQAANAVKRRATADILSLAAAFDELTVEANGLRFPAPKKKKNAALEDEMAVPGTSVFMKLALKKKSPKP
ncbi:MAG: hypothetical protein V4488_18055 [Pseudomonadota bacterium]